MPNRPSAITFRKNEVEIRRDRQALDRHRGSPTQRGYDHKWRKYSKWRLRMNPLCVLCKEKDLIVPATCTDHIRPAQFFPELFWEESNHRSLCAACNTEEAYKAIAKFAK